MKKVYGFLRDNKFVRFAVRFLISLSIILYGQYNPELLFKYLTPAFFLVFAIVEIIFGKKLQMRRDRKRIADGKDAETAMDVRRGMGILYLVFGILLLCYAFLL